MWLVFYLLQGSTRSSTLVSWRWATYVHSIGKWPWAGSLVLDIVNATFYIHHNLWPTPLLPSPKSKKWHGSTRDRWEPPGRRFHLLYGLSLLQANSGEFGYSWILVIVGTYESCSGSSGFCVSGTQSAEEMHPRCFRFEFFKKVIATKLPSVEVMGRFMEAKATTPMTLAFESRQRTNWRFFLNTQPSMVLSICIDIEYLITDNLFVYCSQLRTFAPRKSEVWSACLQCQHTSSHETRTNASLSLPPKSKDNASREQPGRYSYLSIPFALLDSINSTTRTTRYRETP